MIIETIRKAILETTDRSEVYDRIAEELGVSRAKAKELYFRFQYFPTEEFMQKCKDSEQVGINC